MQHSIMGKQVADVARLHLRVQVAIVVMLFLATAGFAFVSFYLLGDVMRVDLKGVESSGLFRAFGITGLYLLRSQHIFALENKTTQFAALTGQIDGIFDRVQKQHWENYEILPSARVAEFYNRQDIQLSVPLGSAWTNQSFTYWTLVNDFARRMQVASAGSQSVTASSDFSLKSMVYSKRSFLYVQENIFRTILPTFEQVCFMCVHLLLSSLVRACVRGCM